MEVVVEQPITLVFYTQWPGFTAVGLDGSNSGAIDANIFRKLISARSSTQLLEYMSGAVVELSGVFLSSDFDILEDWVHLWSTVVLEVKKSFWAGTFGREAVVTSRYVQMRTLRTYFLSEGLGRPQGSCGYTRRTGQRRTALEVLERSGRHLRQLFPQTGLLNQLVEILFVYSLIYRGFATAACRLALDV